MVRVTSAVFLSLVLFGDAASGSDAFCLELAKQSIFDVFSRQERRSSYLFSERDFCRQYRSQRSRNTSALIVGEAGFLDFSDERTKDVADFVCDRSSVLSKSRLERLSESRVLSRNALEAIRACTSRDGVVADGDFDPRSGSLNVDIHYAPPVGAPQGDRRSFVNRTTVAGSINCEGPLMEVMRGGALDNNAVSLQCRRSGESRQVPGLYGNYRVTDGGSVTVWTNVGTFEFVLPRKVVGPNCAASRSVVWESTTENTVRGALGYGDLITDTLQASNSGDALRRVVTYTVDVPSCGDYKIEIEYTSAGSRCVDVSFRGRRASGFCGNTGGWHAGTLQKEAVYVGPLPGGQFQLRLERQGPIPHLNRLHLSSLP